MRRSIIFLLLTFFLYNLSEARTNNNNPSTSIKQKNFRARVYFSNEVPVAGVAKEGKEYNIDANGSFLYVIVDNYPDNFGFSQIKVKVYKTDDNLKLATHDEKTYDINGSLYYTYIKYSFYSAGTYTFDVYTTGGELLGSGSVLINMKSSGGGSNTGNSDPYAKSRVYFSTEVPSYGVAKDVKTFKIKSGGGFVYTIVDNYPNNFTTSSIKVYVYKSENGSYVKKDDATYNINTSYYYTYFKYTFNTAGDYKIVVYDSNDRYINTGYVTINWDND